MAFEKGPINCDIELEEVHTDFPSFLFIARKNSVGASFCGDDYIGRLEGIYGKGPPSHSMRKSGTNNLDVFVVGMEAGDASIRLGVQIFFFSFFFPWNKRLQLAPRGKAVGI